MIAKIEQTMGMIYWIHGYATGLRPAVSFDRKLMLGSRRLCTVFSDYTNWDYRTLRRTHKGFVRPTAACNNTNHSSSCALDDLFCARWKLDPSLALIRVMPNDCDIIS